MSGGQQAWRDQQGGVGHRVRCGLEVLGHSAGVSAGQGRQRWVSAYLGGSGLDRGDAGRVHQGLGPASGLLNQALPLAGQARELLLVLVKARVHTVFKVGWRRDLYPLLLLPKHDAEAPSTVRVQTWSPTGRPRGRGGSPEPARLPTLLPALLLSSSPAPWSPRPPPVCLPYAAPRIL